MPHLCPMNWALLYLTFWLLFISILPGVWWMNLPKFPTPSPVPSHHLPVWHWSCLLSISSTAAFQAESLSLTLK